MTRPAVDRVLDRCDAHRHGEDDRAERTARGSLAGRLHLAETGTPRASTTWSPPLRPHAARAPECW